MTNTSEQRSVDSVGSASAASRLHAFPCLVSRRNTATRAKVVEEWARDGGVLLMGYEMYRLLSLKKSYAAGRKKKSKKAMGPVVIDVDEEDRQQELLKGSGDKRGRGR